MTNPIKIEVTDTFGGESNYSWVRRYELTTDRDRTRLQIVREAKRLAGWTGVRCVTEDHGDLITLRPRGVCQVMFIQLF